LIVSRSRLTLQQGAFPEQHRRNLFNIVNQLWHTDSSFKHIPREMLAIVGA
jgi:hypothetical protein